MRACGGLHGQYVAGHLADVHVHQVTCARFCLEVEAEAIRRRAYEATDAVGTLHFSHWVLFENNHLGFFTIFDGDFAKYIQDFAEKTSFAFDTIFPHIVGAPPTPVAKNAQAFYQWALENNHPPIGFYSAYPGLGVLRTFEPCWPIASQQRPPLDSSRVRCPGFFVGSSIAA